MRLTLKPGEHLRLACDSDANTLSLYIGKGFIHITANEPGKPSEIVLAATETAKVTAGMEARDER